MWFSVFALFTVFGIGSAVQNSAMTSIIVENFDVSPAIVSGIICISALLIIFGGLKSISKICEALVPFMAGAYIIGCLLIWNLPITCFGIEGLTVIQQRVIAIFVFATLSWLFEAIPSWATSLAIISVMCLTLSDNSIACFKGEGEAFGELLKSKDIMATFANPVIMLFLGGFILAIAATKSGLDVLLARTLLKPFGQKSENVLLGFILITGVFSMFVSNTATAAMMLTFLAPVFKALPPEGKGRVALTLSVPVAANIGGMGTPIGTPPNAIALKYLNSPTGLNLGIGFGEWMMYMLPLTVVLLLIGWYRCTRVLWE